MFLKCAFSEIQIFLSQIGDFFVIGKKMEVVTENVWHEPLKLATDISTWK